MTQSKDLLPFRMAAMLISLCPRTGIPRRFYLSKIPFPH